MNTERGNIGRLIAVIANGGSLAQAAEAAGVSVRTVQRRLQDPEVRMDVQEARVDLARQFMGELQELKSAAVGRVRQVLTESGDEQAVLRAAGMVLRSSDPTEAVQLREEVLALEHQVADLAERLSDVEANPQ